MRAFRWHRAAFVLLLALVAVTWAAVVDQRRNEALRSAAHGLALFHGDAALTARLAGHSEPLPTVAVRCANCHDTPSAAPSAIAPDATGSPARTAQPYAGRLTARSLTTARSRRGGPASVYDEAALCRLLRTGVDPAQVLVPTTMPRYEISAQDCRDLWAFLGRRGSGS